MMLLVKDTKTFFTTIKVHVSLAILGGYVPDESQTGNPKTGILGLMRLIYNKNSIFLVICGC